MSTGSIPYASTFFDATDSCGGARKVTVREFLEDDRDYLFESIPWSAHPDHPFFPLVQAAKVALDDFPFFNRPRAATVHNFQFAYGREGTGAPFHFHASALNLLVKGSKRWTLVPPPFASYSKVPPGGAGAAGIVGESGMLPARLRASGVPFASCTQHPGDAILIPSGWAHQVTNLETPTIGGALEFHRPFELAMGFEYRRSSMM